MSNQLATRREIRDLIQTDQVQTQLMTALPRYYSVEKFTSIVRTALNKNPKLAECDQGSFLVAMITAAQMGIMPDGRHGHLIPRWNSKTGQQECQFQADYKGKVHLIRRNANVADIYAEVVRENDVFKITAGLHRDIIHEPDYSQSRGALIGVYAVIQYKDTTCPPSWCYVSREEVESIRERSESWKAHKNKGFSTPWISDEGEMWKKTAINRIAKLADLDPETLDRLDADPELRIETLNVTSTPDIPRAKVPDMPALPQSTEEPEQASVDSHAKAQQIETTVVEDPAPAPKEKPAKPAAKPAAPKPATKAEEPAPKAAKPAEPEAPKDESAECGQVRAKLSESGYTETDLMAVCAAEGWCKATDPLSSLPSAGLQSIVQYWDDEIVPALQKRKEGK